jgi:DNA-binding transcriptional LysR family regulator
MVRPPKDMDTDNVSFAPHPYVIVAPPNHPLVGVKNIALESLSEEPFIVRERGSDTWNSMDEGFAGRLKSLNVAMEITSTETIKQAVIAGMGISFLSAHTIAMELQVGRLAVLDIEGFPVMLNWYLVHRHNKRLPAVAAAFKQFLIDEGAAQISAITHIG